MYTWQKGCDSLAKRNLPEEETIRKDLRQVRDDLKRKIQHFEDSGLEIDNLVTALRHQYSILARLEDELEKVPTDEELLERLDCCESEWDDDVHRKYTRVPTRDFNKLLNQLKRLEAKQNRVAILVELARVNRLFGQNAVAQVQMDEIRAKTEYIKIETHAAMLLAMKDIFYLAMRRMGFTDDQLRALARETMRIEKDYPIIQEDYSRIKARLFGEPENVPTLLEADYQVLPDSIEDLNDVVNRVSVRKAKHRE